MANLRAIHFDAVGAVLDKAVAGIGKQFDRMQVVENHYGLEDVKLKIALRAGKADGGVVAHHLHSDHGQGFALRGIHLAGHDGGAGLVFGERQFAEAAARPGSQPANVVGDFHERGGQRFQRAAGEDDFVVRGERCEFVGMRAEGKSGELGDFARSALREFRMRVEPGADSGAADGQIVEASAERVDALYVAVEQADPAGKFLAHRQRRGVLQVRAADFDDVREFLGFGVERARADFLPPGASWRAVSVAAAMCMAVGNVSLEDCDMLTSSLGWIGLLAAHLAAGEFDGAVGDDLVDVHVGLRAAAGLPDAQREMVVKFSGDDFVGGLRDEFGFFGGEFAEILVDQRGGFLQDAESADELRRHGVVADGEVDQRARASARRSSGRRELRSCPCCRIRCGLYRSGQS